MTQSLSESLSTHRWEIGFTALGLLFAGGLYFYRVNSNKQLLEQIPPTPPTPIATPAPPAFTPARSSQSSDQDLKTSQQLFFDKSAQITKVMNNLQLQNATSLSFSDIRAIYQGSLDIMKDQYFKFTKEIRKRRRLIRKINQNQYLNMVLDYYAKIRDLLERGRLELISYLEIPNEVYEESIFQIHQCEERDDLYRLDQLSQKMMKEKMLKKRSMSDKTAKEIMKQQLRFLKTQLYIRYYEILNKQKINPNIILQVIHTIIEDFIYEKYGFEEEHLIFKRLDDRFSGLEEIKCLTDDLEREEEILMGQILGFTPVYDNQ